jgi:hypothetical protein
VRRVAGGCFEVEFLENKIYERHATKDVKKKYIYSIYGTRQDEDKGRLTGMPSWRDDINNVYTVFLINFMLF